MISPEEKQAVVDLFPFMGATPVVFDAGSNKGGWADIILEEYDDKCDLHFFEPNSKILSYTEIKYEYRKNIKYNNVGLYGFSGVLDFYYFENENNELSSLVQGEDWEGLPQKQKPITITTIDQYCEENNIDRINCLKIDAEGSDFDVLFGARTMLSNDKVGIIQIEYSKHWERFKRKFDELFFLLAKYGYSMYQYKAGNFWKIETLPAEPEFDNYYITKFEVHNYSIKGWNDNFVMNTADLPPMDLVIEIGAMEGCTTKYICEHLLSDNKDARVIVVDPLNDYYVTDDPRYHPEFKHQYQRFLRNTRGLPVNLHRGESKDELPKLNAIRACLVYVDGNHYSPWPYHDLCWAFAITKIGGYILADDYDLWADETKESIDKFLNEFRGHYEIIRQNYQVLIKKTSNHYTELTQSFYL